MNKRVKVYTEVSVSLQGEIFRRAAQLAKELLKESKRDEKEITDAISIAVADKKTKDDVLDLTYGERMKIEMSLNKAISDVMGKQTKREVEQIRGILNFTADHKYGTLQYIASLGQNNKFRKLTEGQRASAVNTAIKGTRWSTRVHKNKSALELSLKKDINDLVNGRKSSGDIITKTRRDFEISRNQSVRLVNTEVARVQNEINHEYAREEGLYKQLFTATLDNATSDICQDLDGQVFDIKDPDLPSIPLHPHCRSVLINLPSDDWKPSTRLDNISKEFGNWNTYYDWYNAQDDD